MIIEKELNNFFMTNFSVHNVVAWKPLELFNLKLLKAHLVILESVQISILL
jgi:hypothetical protein